MRDDTNSKNRVTLVVEGRPEDNGDVRLEDFTFQLDNLRKALTEADRVAYGRQTVYYRIVDLSHNSPATVVLEAVSIMDESSTSVPSGDGGAQALIEGINAVQSGGVVPEAYDYVALDAFRAVAKPVGSRVGQTSVFAGSHHVSIGEEVGKKLDEMLRHDVLEYGSVSGYIERLNIHAGERKFYLYPVIGPDSVKCSFPKALRPRLLEAVGQYATVSGLLKYRPRSIDPYEIVDVEDIFVHPPIEQLPRLSSLRGIFQKEDNDTRGE